MAKKNITAPTNDEPETSLITLQFTPPAAFVFPNKEDSLKIIEGKKAEYSKLKIDGVDDKDGYEAVKTAMAEMKNTRIAMTKAAKENIIDVVNKFAKDFKADLAAIEDALSGVEEELRAKKDIIDTEKERIKAEKALAKQKAIEKRISDLFVLGAYLDNAGYKFAYDESLFLGSLQVYEFSDDEFGEFLEEVKTAWTVEQDRLEAEKTEAIRLQAEQDELAETNRKQAEQNATQAQAFKDKRSNLRLKELKLLDVHPIQTGTNVNLQNNAGHRFCDQQFIIDSSDEEWEDLIQTIEAYEPPVEQDPELEEEPPHPYAGQNTEYFADKPSFNGSSIAEELELDDEPGAITEVDFEEARIEHTFCFGGNGATYKDIAISEKFIVRIFPEGFEDTAVGGCTIHNEGELEPGLRWAVIKL